MNAATLHDLWEQLPGVDGELHTGELILVKMLGTPPALFIAQGLPSPSDFQFVEDELGFALEDKIEKAKKQYVMLQENALLAEWAASWQLAEIDSWRKLRVESVGSYFDSSGALHVYATLRVNPNPVQVVWVIAGIAAIVTAISAAFIASSVASVFDSWSFSSPEAVKIVETAATADPESPLGQATSGFKLFSIAGLVAAAALAVLVFKVKLK